jgi:hypothetical protein
MSDKRRKKASPKKPREILQGHKRVGKRFLPPMASVQNLKPVSYVNQLLPEILWMGLINDVLGYKDGLELCQTLAVTAKKVHQSKMNINFALCSSYLQLSEAERSEIVSRLAEAKALDRLTSCISPLVVLYKGFPLAFLGAGESAPGREDLVRILKNSIRRHIVKYEVPGLVIQAAVMYIRGITGGLSFPKNMKVPDLNAIVSSPESEEAKMAGALVRSFVLTEITLAGEDKKDSWARDFWNQGLHLDGCEFEVADD